MFAKKVSCVVLALLAVFALTSCACNRTMEIRKPAMEEGAEAVSVEGSCDAQLVNGGENLRVSGTCNLMDGTNGVVSVVGADGTTLERAKFTKESEDMTYEFPVQSDWPSVVYGFILFDTQQANTQPREVTDVYGRRFQNLDGEDVIWDLSGVIAVFQSEPVEIPTAAA